jgi:hypothetical protein
MADRMSHQALCDVGKERVDAYRRVHGHIPVPGHEASSLVSPYASMQPSSTSRGDVSAPGAAAGAPPHQTPSRAESVLVSIKESDETDDDAAKMVEDESDHDADASGDDDESQIEEILAKKTTRRYGIQYRVKLMGVEKPAWKIAAFVRDRAHNLLRAFEADADSDSDGPPAKFKMPGYKVVHVSPDIHIHRAGVSGGMCRHTCGCYEPETKTIFKSRFCAQHRSTHERSEKRHMACNTRCVMNPGYTRPAVNRTRPQPPDVTVLDARKAVVPTRGRTTAASAVIPEIASTSAPATGIAPPAAAAAAAPVTMPMDTSSFPPPPPLIGMQKRKREENAGHVIPDRHVTHPPSFAPNTASGVVPASHHASSEKPILPLTPGNI